MIAGATCRALRNKSRTALSDSPTYLLNNSGPLIGKKLNVHSVANALAIMVFEHPGGPYIKIPLAGLAPSRRNASSRFGRPRHSIELLEYRMKFLSKPTHNLPVNGQLVGTSDVSGTAGFAYQSMQICGRISMRDVGDFGKIIAAQAVLEFGE
ncbi:conserved hypothetical protein [Trichinella spiralis]|uniref:hypothetical protein n=1 Tax=Trichinella spiralis TaxID=6334 RepID=UPI0001EFC14A|nr:conserved hypothetical protein [Trichinella spiralis]